jgi:hypothetical protein
VDPDPVKLVVGFIYREELVFERAAGVLEESFGGIDLVSSRFPFDTTDYYEEEMGSPLFRRFCSFGRLIHPGGLVDVKLGCRDVENEFRVDGDRSVNLDPGYMDFGKFLLASFKHRANKVYLSHGVYADLTLLFEGGEFVPFPWSFADMKSGRYRDYFHRVRDLYRRALRGGG